MHLLGFSRIFMKLSWVLFTAQPSNQSPMSLTSDASSPRSYVSPRISTPQTNTVPLKPLMSTPPVSSQPKVRFLWMVMHYFDRWFCCCIFSQCMLRLLAKCIIKVPKQSQFWSWSIEKCATHIRYSLYRNTVLFSTEIWSSFELPGYYPRC